MSKNCKLYGFSEGSDPSFPSETTYTSPLHLLGLIDSNRSLSGIQESQFREMLTENMGSLKALDERIARMRRDLEVLVRQRAKKEREVEEYKSVLHPIRRLPKEILCEIFLSFVNEDLEEDISESSSLEPSSMMWSLPRVSAHWRSVALPFPRMWSVVRLITNDFDMDRLLQKLCLLGVQMHRSANHELSVSIVMFNKSIPKTHPLLPILFATSSRWKDFSLFTRVNSFDSFLPLRGSLPSMTTLHTWAYDQTSPTTTLTMFEFAPKLTRLIGNPHLLRKFNLPFSQITEYGYSIECTCVSHALMLSQIPKVQRITTTCHVDTKFDGKTDVHADHIPQSITLPFATYASFIHNDDQGDDSNREEHSSSDCPLFLRLVLPSLRELDVDVHQSVDALRGLLRRSRCSLHNLSLHVHRVPEDDCISLLKDIPTLTSFTLRKCSKALMTKFLEAFTQSPSIVSSLRILTVGKHALDSVQIEQLKASRPALSVVTV
ncbi:hypothetical protein C8J56DRAFT_1170766 [Mycena floridula]|nr:hypothetical protein C8J56DRAFT_1170766 [Mycena floridula]